MATAPPPGMVSAQCCPACGGRPHSAVHCLACCSSHQDIKKVWGPDGVTQEDQGQAVIMVVHCNLKGKCRARHELLGPQQCGHRAGSRKKMGTDTPPGMVSVQCCPACGCRPHSAVHCLARCSSHHDVKKVWGPGGVTQEDQDQAVIMVVQSNVKGKCRARRELLGPQQVRDIWRTAAHRAHRLAAVARAASAVPRASASDPAPPHPQSDVRRLTPLRFRYSGTPPRFSAH